MDWDDVRPKPESRITLGDNLTTLSIADLRHRISACETEIDRLRAEIAKREAHEQAASQIFKSKS
jgi:uncharacterized small protein (DUF1192 family)